MACWMKALALLLASLREPAASAWAGSHADRATVSKAVRKSAGSMDFLGQVVWKMDWRVPTEPMPAGNPRPRHPGTTVQRVMLTMELAEWSGGS
jgi:hypothetical protein